MTQADLARCRYRLGEVIDYKEEQVLVVDLGPATTSRVVPRPGCPSRRIVKRCVRAGTIEQ
jgi:hypothetical protein